MIWGYIDAGTGSLLVQAIAGGVAGVAVAAKLYWRRLRNFVLRRSDDETKTETETETTV